VVVTINLSFSNMWNILSLQGNFMLGIPVYAKDLSEHAYDHVVVKRALRLWCQRAWRSNGESSCCWILMLFPDLIIIHLRLIHSICIIEQLHTENFNHRYNITVEKIQPHHAQDLPRENPNSGKNPTTTFLRRISIQEVQWSNPSSLGQPNNKETLAKK